MKERRKECILSYDCVHTYMLCHILYIFSLQPVFLCTRSIQHMQESWHLFASTQ